MDRDRLFKQFGPQNRHSFLAELCVDGIVRCVLHLDKDNGQQAIPSCEEMPEGQPLPREVTLGMIDEAWQRQQGWKELYMLEGPPVWVFRRVLFLSNGLCIAWDGTHFGDAPFDTWGVIKLSEAQWTFGRLMLTLK